MAFELMSIYLWQSSDGKSYKRNWLSGQICEHFN